MLNFCVFTFIIYAVAGSVRSILFGGKSRRKTCKVCSAQTERSTSRMHRRTCRITPIELKSNVRSSECLARSSCKQLHFFKTSMPERSRAVSYKIKKRPCFKNTDALLLLFLIRIPIPLNHSVIIRQLSKSLSIENAAFAGLVDGSRTALIPTDGYMYLLYRL